ncbi:alpha/beta hydrolase, partial [Actinoplanes sp. NPDC048791]
MVRVSVVVRVALVVLLVLALLITLAWLLQRRLIYFPDRSAPPPAAQVLAGGEDVSLRTGDGLDLGAWLVRPPPGTTDRRVGV